MNALFLALSLGMATALEANQVGVRQKADKPQVLIVLTSHSQKGNTGQATGYYLSEVTHPLNVFEEAGLQVEFASIKGGEPPVDGLNLDDPINAKYWNSAAFQKAVRNTQVIHQVDAKKYDAIFFAGGHGTMWDFPDNVHAQTLTRAIYENDGVVAAVCHGPAALVNVTLSSGDYLIRGKQFAAFTDDEERAVKLETVVPFLLASTLQQRGGIHQAAANFQKQVVSDQRVVTGQNPASAAGVAEEIVKILKQSSVNKTENK
jgi:putative intracellular protease/amidase